MAEAVWTRHPDEQIGWLAGGSLAVWLFIWQVAQWLPICLSGWLVLLLAVWLFVCVTGPMAVWLFVCVTGPMAVWLFVCVAGSVAVWLAGCVSMAGCLFIYPVSYTHLRAHETG